MKVRIKFKKNNFMKYIGHLDLMRCFQKAMRRSGIPVSYTGGYSPHMIMSFAQPLGVGLISEGEYLDVELDREIEPELIRDKLSKEMPEGMEITGCVEVPPGKQYSAMTVVCGADYDIRPVDQKTGFLLQYTPEDRKSFFAFMEREEIFVLKKTKKSEEYRDIKPLIWVYDMDSHRIFLRLAAGSAENLNPRLVMEAYCEFSGGENRFFSYQRLELYKWEQCGTLVPLDQI